MPRTSPISRYEWPSRYSSRMGRSSSLCCSRSSRSSRNCCRFAASSVAASGTVAPPSSRLTVSRPHRRCLRRKSMATLSATRNIHVENLRLRSNVPNAAHSRPTISCNKSSRSCDVLPYAQQTLNNGLWWDSKSDRKCSCSDGGGFLEVVRLVSIVLFEPASRIAAVLSLSLYIL